MSLGSIICYGLGGDATAMIIGPFRMSISIVVVTPDKVAGGGGGVVSTSPGFYTPAPRLGKETRHVMITVRFGDNKEIKKHFVVVKGKADFMIEVFGWINVTKDRISAAVERVKHVMKKVTTVFDKKDK